MTDSARLRISGSPRPCSWRSRPGSSTEGSGSTSSGENPPAWSVTVTATPPSSSSMRIATGASRRWRTARRWRSRTPRTRRGSGRRCGERGARRRPRPPWTPRGGRGRGGRCGAGSAGGSCAPRGSAPRLAEGLLDGRRQREGALEGGELEDLAKAGARRHEPQVATLAARALQQSDEHAEPGRVDEVHLLEIEDDLRLSADDDLHDPLAQAGGGGEVEVAGGPRDGPAVTVVHLHHQIHRPNLPLCPDPTPRSHRWNYSPVICARDQRTLVSSHGRPP